MRLAESLSNFVSLFRLNVDQPVLLRAQVRSLSRQIPLMYLLLIVNALPLSYTYFNYAPVWMTLICPAVLAVLATVRAIVWQRATRQDEGVAQIITRLRRIRMFAFVMTVLFSAWAAGLYGYGDAYQQAHVVNFISMTAVGCVFCLLTFPPAALTVIVVVMAAFVWRFGLSGNEVYIAISANMVMVALVIIQTIRTYYSAFSGLISSQEVLQEQHRQTIELSDQNQQLAHRDHLTGLANRRDYFNRLEQTLQQHAADHERRFAVALIDLDGFKPVNDIHGHLVGDVILLQAGQRLQEVVDGQGYIARLGGDEFGLIIDQYLGEVALSELGRRICRCLCEPFYTSGGTVQLSGSIGFATYPAAARTATGLFERADFALYHAKRNNPGTPVLFAARHETLIRQEAMTEQALRQADFSAEMTLHFQPIVDLENGAACSAEALARWHSPSLGQVAPDEFFPLAEKTGRIGELTETLFEKALCAASAWPESLGLSFNLSARDIASREMTDWLVRRVSGTRINPARITFEVTETALLRDFDAAHDCISRLRASGAKVALDDFGIGFSSLRYVHELELDMLKIDRSFITPVVSNPRSQRIVRTVIDMCENLDIECVVEGIETVEQRDLIREFGCRKAQGFLFAKPAAAVPDIHNVELGPPHAETTADR